MKYIKLFEELTAGIYKSAGEKLKEIGQIKRGNKLIEYSNKNIRFNMNIDYSLVDFSKKFDRDKGFPKKEYKEVKEVTFEKIGVMLNSDYMELSPAIDFFNEHGSIDMCISFYFRIGDDVFNPFDIFIDIYDDPKQLNDENHKIKISLFSGSDLNTDFDGSSFENKMNNIEDASLADKKSAVKFKKNIILPLLDDERVPISDIISILNGKSSHYEQFIKDIENINTNLLFSDKFSDRKLN